MGEGDHVERWACLSDDQWIVAVRNDKKPSTLLRRVDVLSGALEDVGDAIEVAENGVAPYVEGLTRTADGGCAGFGALSTMRTCSWPTTRTFSPTRRCRT